MMEFPFHVYFILFCILYLYFYFFFNFSFFCFGVPQLLFWSRIFPLENYISRRRILCDITDPKRNIDRHDQLISQCHALNASSTLS